MGEQQQEFGRQIQKQHQVQEKWAGVPPTALTSEVKKSAFEKLGNDPETLAPIIELVSRYETMTRAAQGAGSLTVGSY